MSSSLHTRTLDGQCKCGRALWELPALRSTDGVNARQAEYARGGMKK